MSEKAPKKIFLLRVIHVCALAGLSLLPFPLLFLLLRCWLRTPSDRPVYLYQFLCTAVFFLGLGTSVFLQSRKKLRRISWLPDLLCYLIGIIPAVIGSYCGLYLGAASLIRTSLGVVVFFAWLIGTRAQGKGYYQVLTRNSYLFYIDFSVIAAIIYWFCRISFPFLALTLPFLFLTAIYGAAQNQHHLEYLMERRGHDFSQLPAKIRRYSLGILTVIMGVIFLLLIFRHGIAAFFTWILELLRTVGSWLFLLVFTTEPSDSITNNPSQSDVSGGALEQNFTSPLWNLFSLIMLAAAIYIFIRYGKRMWKWAVRFCKGLWQYLMNLITHGHGQNAFLHNSEYYVDKDISLEGNEELEENPLNGKQLHKKWRREKRKFLKMPDGPEKVKLGYELAAAGMRLKNIPLSPGDTPLEISHKAKPNLHTSLLTPAQTYNTLCYGQKNTDCTSSCELLKAALEELDS